MRSLLFLVASLCLFSNLYAGESKTDDVPVYNNISEINGDTVTSPNTGKKKIFGWKTPVVQENDADKAHKFTKEGYTLLSKKMEQLEHKQSELGKKNVSLLEEVRRVASQGQTTGIGHKHLLYSDCTKFKSELDSFKLDIKKETQGLERDVKELRQEAQGMKRSIGLWKGATFALVGIVGVFAYLKFKAK
jgi:hypothetical protein